MGFRLVLLSAVAAFLWLSVNDVHADTAGPRASLQLCEEAPERDPFKDLGYEWKLSGSDVSDASAELVWRHKLDTSTPEGMARAYAMYSRAFLAGTRARVSMSMAFDKLSNKARRAEEEKYAEPAFLDATQAEDYPPGILERLSHDIFGWDPIFDFVSTRWEDRHSATVVLRHSTEQSDVEKGGVYFGRIQWRIRCEKYEGKWSIVAADFAQDKADPAERDAEPEWKEDSAYERMLQPNYPVKVKLPPADNSTPEAALKGILGWTRYEMPLFWNTERKLMAACVLPRMEELLDAEYVKGAKQNLEKRSSEELSKKQAEADELKKFEPTSKTETNATTCKLKFPGRAKDSTLEVVLVKSEKGWRLESGMVEYAAATGEDKPVTRPLGSLSELYWR